MLALLMENPHVGLDCSSCDAQEAGAGHELFSDALTCVESNSHLSTGFVDLVRYINTFEGAQSTANPNKALL